MARKEDPSSVSCGELENNSSRRENLQSKEVLEETSILGRSLGEPSP